MSEDLSAVATIRKQCHTRRRKGLFGEVESVEGLDNESVAN